MAMSRERSTPARLTHAANRLDAGADLLPTQEPYARMTVAAVERLFENGSIAANAAELGAWPAGAAATRVAPFGVRHFLSQSQGTGYWDSFRPMRHVLLGIADVTYHTRTWIDVHGEGLFKLRFVLSGQLFDENHKLVLEGPAAALALHPRNAPDSGYHLGAGKESRLVILHCHPEALTETIGLREAEIPGVLRDLCANRLTSSQILKLSLNSKALEAALEIVQSRYQYSGTLRANFLEAKCREILSNVLNDLQLAEIGHQTGPGLSARDVNRVLEARDYLAAHFRKPPSIPVLARHIGVSQTKLKAGFRQVLGTTLHAYALELRMRAASEALLKSDRTIAEVAYGVGYEHPASFTCAFKRYYGFLPRSLKSKR